MSIRARRINNQVVRPPPPTKPLDTRPVKGAELFPELYANIFLVAKKKSGKTSVVYKIIKTCATKDTTVIAFVSTLYKDDNWLSIQKYCREKGIPFLGFTSLMDNNVDKLQELIKSLESEAMEREMETLEKEQKVDKSCLLLAGPDSDNEEDEVVRRKSKYRVPDYLLIFDDLSDELKAKSIITLLKKNRHFLCKCIMSSQYVLDIKPESRRQLDYWLVFAGQPIEKLNDIHSKADLSISKELLYKIYKFATKEKYSFLYIDPETQTYRRNFNEEIDINNLT